MSKKIITYINIKDNKLQYFFGMMAFIEKYKKDRIFLFDKNNTRLLEECERYFSFEKLDRLNNKKEFEEVMILIDHSKPFTDIARYFSAPLIFPKLIYNKFSTKFHSKINKIYFRGLFTKSRWVECLSLFISIRDLKAIRVLFSNTLKLRINFKIETKMVNIEFTMRGRQVEYKYIDEDYYSEMSKYKYVFCPKGDFVWTYRFFEAIQVGSIPLSKYSTEEYSEFYYLKKYLISSELMEVKLKNNYLKYQSKYNL